MNGRYVRILRPEFERMKAERETLRKLVDDAYPLIDFMADHPFTREQKRRWMVRAKAAVPECQPFPCLPKGNG